jgi:nitroimidazol reductase NimA-like FMN-containing flavoprotein (pyridoxamine 5'-phosphate oxidase superfamily)
MQNRMRLYQLDAKRVEAVLREAPTGYLGTVGPDGYPYVTPVHFVWLEGKIYIHGNPKGTKIDNLRANPKVSLAIAIEGGLIHSDSGCDTNTRFESVIVKGDARVFADRDRAPQILEEFVAKYTPQHKDKPLDPKNVRMTGILEIEVAAVTGKYYS